MASRAFTYSLPSSANKVVMLLDLNLKNETIIGLRDQEEFVDIIEDNLVSVP